MEYGDVEMAFRGFWRMNGKYLGERLVSVRFYSVEMFREGRYG